MGKANRGNVANSWYQVLFSATTTNGPTNAAALTTAQADPISRVWDPILVAQLTQGGMCCDAEYYSANGVGRGTISEVPAISAYDPPLTGGDMSAETSPGDMCPAHSKDDGYSTTTVGNVNQDNPAETELLEGQAFYVSLAPSQYSLPTTSSTAATQKANEAKQRKCATHITSMMKMNKAVAKTAAGTQTAPGAFGYDYSAIHFQGTEKLGELVKGPNMALIKTNEACGRANTACAAPPATWSGAPAVMATCYGSDCTAAGILNTTGVIPVA